MNRATFPSPTLKPADALAELPKAMLQNGATVDSRSNDRSQFIIKINNRG